MLFTDLLDAAQPQPQVVDGFLCPDSGMQSADSMPSVAAAGVGVAGVLKTDVPMHEEARRLDIDMLGNAFADLDQGMAALVADVG